MRPLVSEIQAATCAHFRCPRSAMTAPSRFVKDVRPRQVAMFLGRRMTKMSFPELGRRFGGRDHTTVMYTVGKIEGMIRRGHDLARDVHAIRAALEPCGDGVCGD